MAGDFVPKDAQVDVLLTDIAIDAINAASDFIAERLVPTHTVPKTEGVYFEYDGEEMRREDAHHADGESANEVSYGLSQTSYGPIQDYALKSKATRGMARELGQERAEKNATMRTVHGILLDREVRLKTTMTDTAIMTNNVTIAGTDQWNNGSTSTPVEDIRTGRVAVYNETGRIPNTLVLPYEVFTYLEVHPDLVGRVNGLSTSVTVEQMKSIFQVDEIILAKPRENTAKQGATDSISSLWGKNAWLLYINPQAPDDREYVTFGHTLRVEGDEVATRTMKWDDPDPTKHTVWVATESSYEQKVMAPGAAYYMKNVIA